MYTFNLECICLEICTLSVYTLPEAYIGNIFPGWIDKIDSNYCSLSISENHLLTTSSSANSKIILEFYWVGSLLKKSEMRKGSVSSSFWDLCTVHPDFTKTYRKEIWPLYFLHRCRLPAGGLLALGHSLFVLEGYGLYGLRDYQDHVLLRGHQVGLHRSFPPPLPSFQSLRNRFKGIV
jgi:hypothetical protein